MDSLFKFYDMLKRHDFTDEEAELMLETIKKVKGEGVVNKDDFRQEFKDLRVELREEFKSLKSSIDKTNDRVDKLYDKVTALVFWIVGTGVAILSIIISYLRLMP